MDIAFDPRWGRVHETYGEDPLLAATFAVAFVRGLQGDDLSTGRASPQRSTSWASGSGWVASNAASFEAGRRFTRDVVAFPIEAAINEAGLRSVMSAYGDVDGIPAGVNRELLNDLLREARWASTGFVIADYMALQHALDRSLVADDIGHVARLGNPRRARLGSAVSLGLRRGPRRRGRGGPRADGGIQHVGHACPDDEVRTRSLRAAVRTRRPDTTSRRSLLTGPISPSRWQNRSVILAPERRRAAAQTRREDCRRRPTRPRGEAAVCGIFPPDRPRDVPVHGIGRPRQPRRHRGISGRQGRPADTIDLDTDAYVRLRYGIRSLGEEVGELAGASVAIEPGCGPPGFASAPMRSSVQWPPLEMPTSSFSRWGVSARRSVVAPKAREPIPPTLRYQQCNASWPTPLQRPARVRGRC